MTVLTTSKLEGAISCLVDAQSVGANVADELARLRSLAASYQSGEYIDVVPDLSGFGYIVCFKQEGRDTRRGTNTTTFIRSLATTLDQPVVICSFTNLGWATALYTKLTRTAEAGPAVTAIVED